MTNAVYRRVMVKVSGEALMGPDSFGIHQATLERIAADLVAAHALGVAIGFVVGGGNIFRGVTVAGQGIPRVTADMMGILATVMNALALEARSSRRGQPPAPCRHSPCRKYARPTSASRALRHLEEDRIVLLAAGTGNPFFTTDTTAVLRAAEIGAKPYSRPPMWTASTAPTRRRIGTPCDMNGSTHRKRSSATSK